MATVPVAKETLTWARNFRNLTIEDAAQRLRMPIEDLVAIENGDKAVNTSTFKKFAQRYRLPEATLARPRPPVLIAEIPSGSTTYPRRE